MPERSVMMTGDTGSCSRARVKLHLPWNEIITHCLETVSNDVTLDSTVGIFGKYVVFAYIYGATVRVKRSGNEVIHWLGRSYQCCVDCCYTQMLIT